MAVTLQLHQVTTPLDGPVYRVNNTIVRAEGISGCVFVFKVVNDAFDHYASPVDIERYPTNKDDAIAAGLVFYRRASVERDWDSVHAMNSDLFITVERIQGLLNEWSKIVDGLTVDRTLNLSAE